jgi:MORN repeat
MQTGEVYEGGWCRDKKSGLGTFRWNGLGDKYIGEFHDDKLHGKGELYRSDGSVWRGSWNCGRKSGPGSVRVSAVHATVPSYRRSGELPVKPKSRLPSLSLLEPSGYDSNVTGFPTPDVLVLKPNLKPKFDSIGSGPVSSSGKSLFVRTLL